METTRKPKRRRRCWTIAKAQAQRPDDGRVFLRWLPLVLFGVAMAGITGRPNFAIRRILPEDLEQPRNEYEGGKPTKADTPTRYKVRPSMHRLLKDVGRRFARNEAVGILMSRLPDAELSAWVALQIDADDLTRLRLHARPGVCDKAVIAGWRGEVARDRHGEETEIADQRDQAALKRAILKILSDDKGSSTDVIGQP